MYPSDTHTFIFTHIYIYIYIYIYMYPSDTYTHLYSHTFIFTYMYIYIPFRYTYIYIYIYVHKYICAWAYMYASQFNLCCESWALQTSGNLDCWDTFVPYMYFCTVCMYIHTYIHVYIHVYIHMYICVQLNLVCTQFSLESWTLQATENFDCWAAFVPYMYFDTPHICIYIYSCVYTCIFTYVYMGTSELSLYGESWALQAWGNYDC